MNTLPKNLREMDENQFMEVFNLLREKTKNWTEFTPKVLKENPQILFVLRISLGLSQLELAKLIGVDKQWVRHFEAGRQGFKQSKTIPQCVKTLQSLFKGNIISLEKAIAAFRRNQNARKKNFIIFPEPKFKLKRTTELTPRDLILQFNLLRKETNNFRNFNPEIIIRNPEFFSMFRIILKMNINEFSKTIHTTSRNLRRWESLSDRIMPETAIRLMQNIESLFKENNLIENVDPKKVLENFLNKFSFFGPGENQIKEQLESSDIQFDFHSIFVWRGNKLIVDFVIPSENEPKIIIEVTRILDRKWGDITRRIDVLDHRFQLLKIINSKLKTIIFIKCPKKMENSVKSAINKEVVNTDVVILNDFSKVPKTINEFLNKL